MSEDGLVIAKHAVLAVRNVELVEVNGQFEVVQG